MKLLHLPLPFLVLLILAGPAAVAPAQVVSTFDADLEGWLILGDNAGTWQATGGNPGGCMDINDLVTGQLNVAAAPAAFLGDWSALTASDSLAFDIYFDNLGGSNIGIDWIFRVEGPGGSALGLVPGTTPPENAWATYAIAIDPADWVLESGTWAGLIGNVTSVELWVEFVNGPEEVRIDNVRLDGDPVPVFEPCAGSDFNGTGLDDWSFAGTGSVGNPNNGDGDGGGYLRVNDTTSTDGFAFAPARMLGDWTALDGAGEISVSIRVESHAGTNEGSPEFLRLTGAGGSAHVALVPAQIPLGNREWRQFRFPLDEAAWTVDSGTWSGLLAFVDECRVDTDFFSGGGVVGIDNFGRLADGCAPLDDTVTAYGLPRCGTYSLVGVNGLAVNPADGTLHGLVRGDGSRDGVYPLLGAAAQTRLHANSNPAGLVFTADGDGFVSEDFGGNIFRFVGADSSSVWVSGFHSGDDDPFGMTIAPPGFDGPNVSAGDILVVDRGNSGADEIWAFSPDTPEGELRVTPDPGSVDWFDIAAAPDGNVWVCDALDDANLYALAPDGTLTPLPLSAPIGAPSGIAVDPADTMLYVAGRTDDAVYRVDPATGDVELVADGFVDLGLTGIEVGATGRRLWVADRGTHRIYEFCLPAATAVDDVPVVARGPELRAHPNPFNPMVRLQFELGRPGPVSLRVFDVAGRLVRTLVDRRLGAGPQVVSWDGRDGTGTAVASGTYFVRLDHGTRNTVARVMLVR